MELRFFNSCRLSGSAPNRSIVDKAREATVRLLEENGAGTTCNIVPAKSAQGSFTKSGPMLHEQLGFMIRIKKTFAHSVTVSSA